MDKAAHGVVQSARAKERWTSSDFSEEVFDPFKGCHGDCLLADDEAIVDDTARLDDKSITVMGTQKGRGLQENIRGNFGSPHPEGYRKALQLTRQAEKFNRPAITLIDTTGTYCGIGAEERGEGEAIAKNLLEVSGLEVPTIAVIIGEGGSGGVPALGLADEVWMLEETIYTTLSLEGSASTLWGDGSRAAGAAELIKTTAPELCELGIAGRVIPETFNGEQLPWRKVTHIMKKALIEKSTELV